jgi:hypothetical protein
LGGPGFEGHFPNKKGHLKIFSRKSWGGGVSKFFSGHTKQIFQDISHFFLKIKIFFRIYQKIFRHITYFSGNEKNFPENNINSSFQKCPFGKKRQSLRHFSRKKRALCSRKKGTCQNLGGGWPPLAPPGSYAPAMDNKMKTSSLAYIYRKLLNDSKVAYALFIFN